MRRSFLLLFTLLMGLSPMFAQTTSNGGAGSANRNDNEEIMNQFLRGIAKNETPTDIKGSPYLNSDFQQAKLVFPENKPLTAAVRYNVAKEEMQVQFDEESFRVLHPGVIVEMNNNSYKMLTYKGEDKTVDLLGYFEILTSEPDSKELVLLKKYKKEVRRGKAAAAMQKATSPRYTDKDYFYIMFKDSKPIMVEKKRKNFVQQFPEAHQDQVKKFMKENKLKPKNQNDLQALVNYYNTTF